MKTAIKDKWVKALRSGEYAQGKGHFVTAGKKYDSFCCLGVLADIQGAEWEMNSHERGYEIDGKAYSTGHYVPNGPSKQAQTDLADMNDSGDSFHAIAKYIKSRF